MISTRSSDPSEAELDAVLKEIVKFKRSGCRVPAALVNMKLAFFGRVCMARKEAEFSQAPA